MVDAGLFSTTNDLAKYMQMHLQKGYYGGERLLKVSTVDTFTHPCFPENRRGLGWDKPDKDTLSYVPNQASASSFGHSGFTGCVVWADPEKEMVMIFLSNRVHPSAENQILIQKHIRRKIFNQAYQAIQVENQQSSH